MTLQNAVYSSSLTDDDALLAAALAGSDTFNLSAYGDVARGFGGNDTLHGNGGSDILYGGPGNDRLYGGSGHDTLDGGAGADLLDGGHGNDIYMLTSSGDTVVESAGAGTDTVRAAYSHALAGNVENLVLTGTAAINGTGNVLANRLTGNAAANVLNGGAGADALLGQGGADRILGGSGRDTLTGGAGNDQFQFNSRSEAGDIITDFSNAWGNNDQFRISAAGFGGGLVAGTTLAASSFQTRVDNAAQDANDRFIFRTTDKTLWFDADGRGGAAAVLVADLQATASLTSADILLI